MENIKKNNFKIKVIRNGPYSVIGRIPLDRQKIVYDKEKFLLEFEKISDFPEKNGYLLCRCGHSKDKPYCDNMHIRINFDGTETAGCISFSNGVEEIDGPGMKLFDQPRLCALAHFCTRAGGTWELTRQCDDPRSRGLAIKEAMDCPSGRLVLTDNRTGQAYEKEFEPLISIIYDEVTGVGGPIQVKGNIMIESAEGHEYEIRNRVTLCRCGESKNKPFCNGSHIHIGFQDDK